MGLLAQNHVEQRFMFIVYVSVFNLMRVQVCFKSKCIIHFLLSQVVEPNHGNVDLRDIKVIPKLGGTVEDTELIEGLVLTQKTASGSGGGLRRMEKARIGLIQFCLSPPKTDMENQVVLSDYTQMDRVLREERQYTLNLVKQIKKAGCNVLLIQKSILRDALSDLALHFLNKMKILVVKDIERDDIEFVCKSTGCKPIASIDHFVPDMLATAELVEEVNVGTGRIVKVRYAYARIAGY